jgi:hypothetical protein
LSRALAREIAHDAGDLANHAATAWQHADHAATE